MKNGRREELMGLASCAVPRAKPLVQPAIREGDTLHLTPPAPAHYYQFLTRKPH